MVGILFPDYVPLFTKAVTKTFFAGIILFAVYLPIEAILLSTIGTTPGKWLFGIRITTNTGDKLTFGQALARALYVSLNGMGLGVPVVASIMQLLAYQRLTKAGATRWDASGGYIVSHTPWNDVRKISCFVAVSIAFILWRFLGSILPVFL